MQNPTIEIQAKLLAADNRDAEPDIQRIYWFPDATEVRLIALTPTIPQSSDGIVHPFYFRPSVEDNLPAPSAIALIRPEEFGVLRLPPRWGDWKSAVEMELEMAS